MRAYINLLTGSLILLLALPAFSQQTTDSNCDQYKNGYFEVQENFAGKRYAIKREGDTQIETDPNGTVFKFDVNWVDQCTYTLTLDEIKNNPNDISWIEGQVITVEILNTSKSGYTQRSTSNTDDLIFEKQMVEVKPDVFNENMPTLGLANDE